ncbi:hypothetical protein, partial [Escherichia coli]|uniref:hypothetical protein n=1 Tax=Escherichia coli TaxID=562 RepID=UPI003EE14068
PHNIARNTGILLRTTRVNHLTEPVPAICFNYRMTILPCSKARAIGGGVLEALMMLMHQGVKATKEVLEVA